MFDFLYNPNGRISRKGYLLAFFLPHFLLTQIGPWVIPQIGFVWTLVGLFFFWPGLVAVPVKRFHDMGATGWYHAGVLLLLLVAAGIAGSGLITQMQEMGLSFEELEALQQSEMQKKIVEITMQSSRAMLGFGLMILVSLAEFALFAIVAGTSGPNKYGNDPLTEGRGFAD